MFKRNRTTLLISSIDFCSQRVWNDLIDNALEEDGAWFDRTSLGLNNYDKQAEAVIVAKEKLVVAGQDLAAQTFYRLAGEQVEWIQEKKDGEEVDINQPIAMLKTKAWALLAGERTALNFLQRLSGIATQTRRYVDKVADLKTKIVDTRKTIPCFRVLEKYAVRCGGGLNHRFGLHDGCLIKDNHIRFAGGIKQAVESIRQKIPHLWQIEVEVETIDQVEECLALGIDAILLDNMPILLISKAVEMIKGRVLVEASGGINLENVREIAQTGVDLISVGALTHSACAVDISLDLKNY